MELNALLDVDLIAMESEDEVSVLLELAAPQRAADCRRPPGTLQVVLDRSGSMADGRLDAAKHALESLIARLDPTDNFGLVVFDDEVTVAIPAGKLTDKDAARHAVRSILPGSTTNLSSGYLRGIQEARRIDDGRGATLLLLSDGHANEGILDHVELDRVGANALANGVTTSTIGIGLGYDEELMTVLARGGGGNTQFAEHADSAGVAIAAEADDLLEQVVQAASLTVRPSESVTSFQIWNDLPAAAIEGGLMVELGNFYSGEERRLLLSFQVPAMTALGLQQICEFELTYVDATTLGSETITVPINVNVVPGDEAAGRVANPTVTTERAFQGAQRAKRDAEDAMRSGDVDRARQIWGDAGQALRNIAAEAPAAARTDIAAEVEMLDDLSERASFEDASRISKMSVEDRHYKQRRRGRRRS